MPYPDPQDPDMTVTDLHGKLRAITYEIQLAEEFKESLPDLHDLKRAYEDEIIRRETEAQMKVQVPA